MYEQGECHPTGQGYAYTVDIIGDSWNVEVYHKNILIGKHNFPMSYRPVCGMDVLDAQEVDSSIDKIIRKHLKEHKL